MVIIVGIKRRDLQEFAVDDAQFVQTHLNGKTFPIKVM